MMHKFYRLNLILCSLLCLVAVLMAENLPECKSDEDKIKGCVEKRYYDNGKLEAEISFKDGKLEGDNKEYYENGNLKTEASYKNDKLEGIEKWYYKNGNLKMQTSYKNGEIDGIWKIYYENGGVKYEFPYKNGNLEGIVKTYYENGNLMTEAPVKNDKIVGMQKVYMSNGNFIMALRYQDDGKIIGGKCSNNKNLNDSQLKRINDIFNSASILPDDDLAQICDMKLEK